MFTVRFCFLINGALEYKNVPLEEVNLRKTPRSKILYITVMDHYHKVHMIILMQGKVKIISNETTTNGSVFGEYYKVLKLRAINGTSSIIFHSFAKIYMVNTNYLRFLFKTLKDSTSREYKELQKRVQGYYEKEVKDDYSIYLKDYY